MTERMNGDRQEEMGRNRRNETRHVSGGSGTYMGDSNMPMVRENMPDTYRNDFRDIYRGYRHERMNKSEKNIFKNDRNYRQYNSEDEIFECIVNHLTKGVMFHDKMMDLYGFLGLHGFKKMHEYQYFCESISRRKVKCYVMEHMNVLLEDKPDDAGLDFIPQSWYEHNRHDIDPNARKQYIGPSFHGYKQWEEETKDLLSYCANELMYMGKMADFNEVMEMVKDVDKEIEKLESLMIKLKAVDFDIQYIMDMQDDICEDYEEKMEECFEEKLECDKKSKKYKSMYGKQENPAFARRRSMTTGRYI